jgi:hypothetical protein
MAAKQLDELKDQIKELLEKGYICPSSPPMGSPYDFCPKEGWYSTDMCVLSCSEWGYRREQAPLPRIDDLFGQLRGVCVCSLRSIFESG